jgi:hypothetical protein
MHGVRMHELPAWQRDDAERRGPRLCNNEVSRCCGGAAGGVRWGCKNGQAMAVNGAPRGLDDALSVRMGKHQDEQGEPEAPKGVRAERVDAPTMLPPHPAPHLRGECPPDGIPTPREDDVSTLAPCRCKDRATPCINCKGCRRLRQDARLADAV